MAVKHAELGLLGKRNVYGYRVSHLTVRSSFSMAMVSARHWARAATSCKSDASDAGMSTRSVYIQTCKTDMQSEIYESARQLSNLISELSDLR